MEQNSGNEVDNLAYYIDNKALVTVTEMGHLLEIQYMQKQNASCGIKVLNANEYVNLSTGEIKEFKKSETKADSYKSLMKTFKRLRYLINNNFRGNANELFVTLTYKENMTDTKRLYADFDKFMKRLRYNLKKDPEKFGVDIEYISVVEPQGRGAWHCHVLMKFVGVNKVYVSNSQIADLWGHGFVSVRGLQGVDNIGAYITPYLTNMELTNDTAGIALQHDSQIITKEVEGVEKQFIKGGRLHLYPSGMNLYRKSRGIKMPERKTVRMETMQKKIAGWAPSYQKKVDLETEDFQNTLVFLEYNNKRGS